MKLVIGVTGEIGSGKNTFTEKLIKIARSNGKNVSAIRFSDILKDTLELWHLPLTRQNFQLLAVSMNEVFGPNTLAQAVYQKTSSQISEVIILDGIRWVEDFEMVTNFPNNLIVYIKTDGQKRFERIRQRSEKKQEQQNLTFEQFQQSEQTENEQYVSTIGPQADEIIENNGTDKELEQKVHHFYDKYLNSLN